MTPFAGFVFQQLLAVPKVPDDSERDPVPAQLFAALTAAHAELSYAEQSAIVVAWQRRPASERVEVIVGGRPSFPPADPGPLLYPPGAQSTPLSGEGLFDGFPVWLPCLGQADSLWLPESGKQNIVQRRGGFDDYAAAMTGPFAWLVLAEPASEDTVGLELTDLANRIPQMRQRESSQADRIALERAEGRFRELARARPSGLWNVRILVGAMSEAHARRAAALLCSASDLDELPYSLCPGTVTCALTELAGGSSTDAHGAGSPFLASTELLSAVARPPARELPGLRAVERAEFDLTAETIGHIPVGAVVDRAGRAVDELRVDSATLNRHVFVAGATGSGKSQTVRHLLEGIHQAGVPWLVIEPAKAEYARMAGRLAPHGEVAVIRPGDPDAIPVGLNPLEPEAGFPLQTHLDLVRELFLAAFQADEPFPQVLAQGLTRCYEDAGWDLTLSESRFPFGARFPSLGDLQRAARAVVDDIGYGREIEANVRGFIDVRLGSLRLGTPGRFFAGGHPVDMADLLSRNVVLEIENVGNDQDKAFFIGVVLIRLVEHLRIRQRTDPKPGLRHVTVVEEAHRLLRRVEASGPAARAVEMFAALLAEIRAYGEGIIIAEQIPTKIIPDVLKNTALKITHRLPAADDRDVLGATMNLDEPQSRHVVTLPPGRAAAFADGMDRPVLIDVPYGEARERIDELPPVVKIAGTHTAACGPECAAHPCTLRQIAEAARVAKQAELVLWIELTVVAHVTANPEPVPTGSWWRTLLAEIDHRVLGRAVGLLAQQAVDGRYPQLAP